MKILSKDPLEKNIQKTLFSNLIKKKKKKKDAHKSKF